MRIIVLLAALSLSACSMLADPPPTSVAGQDPICERYAVDRAIDVSYQGFDEELQQREHDQVYRDCIGSRSTKMRAIANSAP